MAHTYDFLVRAYSEDDTFLDMAIGEGGREAADAQAKYCVTKEFERAHVCQRVGDSNRFKVVAGFNKEEDDDE